MKQYDVFISYSRRDMGEANLLCAELDAVGVEYWIDRNIHGSANFLSEITANIRRCRVVLFIASNNSANSEWTQKEILFALKHKKQIIPYRIGEFSFESNDELDFVFTNVQWLENRADVVRDICEICGIEQRLKAKQEAERMAREEQERIAREEAERRAREELERIAKEEAERMAREEQERIAKEEAERRAREELGRRARQQAEMQRISEERLAKFNELKATILSYRIRTAIVYCCFGHRSL